MVWKVKQNLQIVVGKLHSAEKAAKDVELNFLFLFFLNPKTHTFCKSV